MRCRRVRGQAGSKKTVAMAIISHGNTPMGNSRQVITWKATTASHAQMRVRRHSRSGTTRQSNAAPATDRTWAVSGWRRSGPRSGTSERAGSQKRSGMPRRSQSGWSLASPAEAYTMPTWNRRSHTHPRATRLLRAGRRRASRLQAAPNGTTSARSASSVTNQ